MQYYPSRVNSSPMSDRSGSEIQEGDGAGGRRNGIGAIEGPPGPRPGAYVFGGENLRC